MKLKTITNFSFYLALIFVMTISLTACKGPAGADGLQGPQGPAGPVGPAGENGSVMHAGQGEPGSGIGNPGDYYLDTLNSLLYGPKTEDNTWGIPIDLKGADGQDGADGSQILSGTTSPAASLGSEGDFYLNTTNFDLYGPKTQSGWGIPINLQATTNVMYSSWFNIVWNDIDDPVFKTMRIPESRITQEFLNTGGSILVYIKQTITNAIVVLPLPLLQGNDYLTFGAGIITSTSPFSGVIINQLSVDETTALTVDYTDPIYEFRYVLIPGSQQISPKAGPQLPIDMKDYEQVQKYFGIRDVINKQHPIRRNK